MNTNSGNDPMLSSFVSDEWCKFPLSSSFVIPVDGLLSPDQHFSDLTAMWPEERKRVLSVKMEEDDDFSEYSVAEDVASRDVDGGDIDMDETAVGSNTTVIHIKKEIEDDDESCDVAVDNSDESFEYKYEGIAAPMTECEARKFVEERFEKITFVPKSCLSQREKIESILARSDCDEFSVETILNFDKKCLESARACAKIVQNIPQRYRWECVQPEDIPSCYTIVADCKKASNRDKPPRPMNAFMIWAQGARRLINELCPKMQNALISEALGYYWRQKSDAFKQIFEQEKIKLRMFHNVEFPEYKYKPKTKVQKAKEKQQLSLTKAKIRASVKLEKLRRTEETPSGRADTNIRPKKIKNDSVKYKDIFSQMEFDKSARKSPTKPEIKDMLTQKILNDRLCKGTNIMCSKPQEFVYSSFKQMSPLEMNIVDTGDTADETTNRDSSVNIDKEINGKIVTTSSVFDTPANTPPVDEQNEEHHSPLHSQHISQTVSITETTCHSSNINQTSPKSFPVVLHIQEDHNRPMISLLSKQTTRPLSNQKQHSVFTFDQDSEVTDWFFNYITESLSSEERKTNAVPKYTHFSSTTTDANNNSSDLNNNCCHDSNNNNNFDLQDSSAFINTKLPLSPNECGDLDALLLDLNSPFLSDADLRSILNTL